MQNNLVFTPGAPRTTSFLLQNQKNMQPPTRPDYVFDVCCRLEFLYSISPANWRPDWRISKCITKYLGATEEGHSYYLPLDYYLVLLFGNDRVVRGPNGNLEMSLSNACDTLTVIRWKFYPKNTSEPGEWLVWFGYANGYCRRGPKRIFCLGFKY